jgi:SNF2 family DNA or RNA helicase
VGRPGVLLADDMGLGKTLQALVFLVYVKEAMNKGLVRRAPVLIVAPTGLLSNWEHEHLLHLNFPGLGRVVRAHGSDLAALRSKSGREIDLAAPVLEYERLLEADWVLTTYETLRDYQHSFGKIPFAAIVLDEVQKTKTPGTLVTEATKAMKAEFVLTMTGTPIENRLADLWCIVDIAQPGLLGDLKTFSSRFEQNRDPADLARLKERLDGGTPSRPPIMLRRLKADHLPGLPEKHEHAVERRMPAVQSEYYRKAVQEARADRSRGKLLQVLQRLRVLSLHPLPPGTAADDQYIASSARYVEMFEILDRIHKDGEKALIFVEFLEPQAYLATLLQRRYRMASPPLLINGAVTGPKRQERVDRFQAGLPGFDVILLSPRAGGVGITLTAANHVIHLSRWWNPAVEDQCTDRVYRIGQTKPVHVYYPAALFPDDEEHSFDRRLHALLTEKRSLSRDMLIPPAATSEDAQRLYDETIG